MEVAELPPSEPELDAAEAMRRLDHAGPAEQLAADALAGAPRALIGKDRGDGGVGHGRSFAPGANAQDGDPAIASA